MIQISDLSLNYAPYYAGQLLGVDVPLGPADYSDTYVVKVGPSGEKAWSEVSTAADVSVSAEVRAG